MGLEQSRNEYGYLFSQHTEAIVYVVVYVVIYSILYFYITLYILHNV